MMDRQPLALPRTLELVGPAGAGKTTLLRTLRGRDETVRLGLHVGRIQHVPVVVRSAVSLLPAFRSLRQSRQVLPWDDMKRIVRLNAMRGAMRREVWGHCRAVVLDEGPVFLLSWFHAFGQEGVESDHLERWSQRMVNQWVGGLDAIIWLDAPDPVLAHRIRTRQKPHRMKEAPEPELHQFLQRYRSAYEWVISRLTTHYGPAVMRFDTAAESIEAIADAVLAAAHGEMRACPRLA
jgi:shikimate kinase